MCKAAPNDFGGVDSAEMSSKDALAAGGTAVWKKWRSPVYAGVDDGEACEPLNGKITLKSDEDRKPIYGIGRNYNRQLGIGAYRTGASIKLDCSLEKGLDIIRRNITEAAEDPQSTVRLMVQGDQFWFSQCSAVELFDMTVMVGDAATARAERLNAHWEDAVPVGVCVCEELEKPDPDTGSVGSCCCSWLFRHDVIDGWRALRYLCRLVLGDADLTLDRLYKKHAEKVSKDNPGQKLCKAVAQCITPVCFAPLAAHRAVQVAMVHNQGARRQFYCHIICGLERLKQLGQMRGTGALTSTLTACILEAFFAADPSRTHANVASNVLFNPTAPDGNHMCLKVACIPRKGNTMQKTVQALDSTSQKVADLWVASLSRKYALGELPEPVADFLDARQKGLDFLVSSLPAYDRTTPIVLDLKVSREFTAWNPSIVYALGIGEHLFLDFYWEVPDSFADAVFCRRVSELLEATKVETTVPPAY